ncbi:glycosyl hydrolase family 18 protein [Collimonas fungivorans]|uniref:glycosyl hydrolase family 18 protein n=1 Tax=Collimonas fungivorans TaxID=158899 RepID=UPI0026F05FBD|nr:glycosyl hydrolase family 18 protein [Collimonas fungivorans]
MKSKMIKGLAISLSCMAFSAHGAAQQGAADAGISQAAATPAATCQYSTWTAGINYAIGSVVQYPANGSFYKEVNAGTNGSDGTDPTISTWYWQPTTCSGPATPPPTGFIYSPYFYSGDYNGDQLNTTVTGSSQILLKVMPAKLQAVTWAFATGSCGSENWSGVSASAFAKANVASFVNAGKKYIVATGGGGGSFTCTSDANFTKFIKTYYSANLLGIDFDIESSQTQSDINNLVARVSAAQAAYPNLRYSFTLATDGGNESQSLGGTGVKVMTAIQNYGLKNYTINLMTMDFAESGQENAALCTLNSSGKCDMGKSTVAAAESLHNYWKVPYSQIEVTPMIGGNDSIAETFTLADAVTVSNYALSKKLAGIHFWAFSRDRDCAPPSSDNNSSGTCNDYGKAGTLGYTNKFISALGL